jgi:hypothetical protein
MIKKPEEEKIATSHVIMQKYQKWFQNCANLVGRKGLGSMAGCLPAIKSVTSSAVAVAAVRPIMPSSISLFTKRSSQKCH